MKLDRNCSLPDSLREIYENANLYMLALRLATSHADSDKSVTADQVNGTWKTKGGEFKALGAR